jgi:hypothetical protein
MYEDASQPPEGASQPSNTEDRLNGLMSLARKRQAESEAALARAADAEAELAATRRELDAVKELLASAPEPREALMDMNRAPKRSDPPAPVTADDARQRMMDAFHSEAPDIVKAMRGY